MKTILNYLDNMFMNLPNTEEARHAKEELANMMEDKYNELIADGKKENEAVGIVISEFGNLQELAAELGLEDIMNCTETKLDTKVVSKEEAEEYLNVSQKTSKKIAIATMLCIYSPILLIFLYALEDNKGLVTETFAASVGITVLLGMIAVAVAIFIINGMKMEKFEYLKVEKFTLNSYLDNYIKKLEEEKRFGLTVLIIIGVSICTLGILPLIIVGILYEDNEFLQILMVIAFLLLLGIAVYLFITAGMEQECYKVLRQVGEFSSKGKKATKLIDKIAGPYWMLATVIYLTWSFISMRWGYTWIVWPIAGICFAFIAAVLGSISKSEN